MWRTWALSMKAALLWTVLFYGLFWTHPLVWAILGLGTIGAWFQVLCATWRALTTPAVPVPSHPETPRAIRRVIFEEEVRHD